ncbi:hypothetical protein V6R21_25615 [Limibacter armeniacum]
MDNSIVYTIIFIFLMSTLFPMAGYYMDFRHRKKMHQRKQK